MLLAVTSSYLQEGSYSAGLGALSKTKVQIFVLQAFNPADTFVHILKGLFHYPPPHLLWRWSPQRRYGFPVHKALG